MSQPPSSARAGALSERPHAAVFAPDPAHLVASSVRLKPIVLVGLMGVGKTTIGRGLAAALSAPFRDTDEEVERAAQRSVAEIFAERGEAEFRDGERRVIMRLLAEPPPHVLAFGGGAFMNAETRALVQARAISIWLKADVGLLARRVGRKTHRPLVQGKDPLQVLTAQAEARHPIYAEADLTVEAGERPPAMTVTTVLEALAAHLGCGGAEASR